jgi:hypothetical protein
MKLRAATTVDTVDEAETKAYFKKLIIDWFSMHTKNKTRLTLSRNIVAMHILLKLCPSQILKSDMGTGQFDQIMYQFNSCICMLLQKVEDDLIWNLKYLSIEQGDITVFYNVWMQSYYNKRARYVKVGNILSRFHAFTNYKYDKSLFIETFNYVKSKKQKEDATMTTNSAFIDEVLLGSVSPKARVRVNEIIQAAITEMLGTNNNNCTNSLRFVCYYFTDQLELSVETFTSDDSDIKQYLPANNDQLDIPSMQKYYEIVVSNISRNLIKIISHLDNWYNIDFDRLEKYISIWGCPQNNNKSIQDWSNYFQLIEFTLSTRSYERVTTRVPTPTDVAIGFNQAAEIEDEIKYKYKKFMEYIDGLKLFQGEELMGLISLNSKDEYQNIHGMNKLLESYVDMCVYDQIGPEPDNEPDESRITRLTEYMNRIIEPTTYTNLYNNRNKLIRILNIVNVENKNKKIEELVELVSFTDKGKQYWIALYNLFNKKGEVVEFEQFDSVFVQEFNNVANANVNPEENTKLKFTKLLQGQVQDAGFKMVKTYLQTPLMCNDGRIRKAFRLKGRGNILYVMSKKEVVKRSDIKK